MKWLRIILIIVAVCIGLALLPWFAVMSGCIGAGDAWVEMPPLRVEGTVIDTGGNPVAGEVVSLGLSTWVYDSETYAAIRGHHESVDHADNWIARVVSTSDGTFEHTFPSRSYNHPAAILFWRPIGGDTRKDLRLLIVPNDGQGDAYWIRVHSSDAIFRMVEDDIKLPVNARARAQRSEKGDQIEFTIVIPSKPTEGN